MAPKKFLDLPEDIQKLVIHFVVRPTDQVSLCLTCSHLHRITVPDLYKCIDVDLGGEADERLPAFLNPANIGLKYIKEVELYLEAINDRCNQLRQAAFAVKMILEMLPRDQLDIFRWHPWDQFSAENMVLLCRKQKRLKWFGAIGMDKPFDAEMEKRLDLDTATKGAQKLGLYPDSRDMLEFSNAVLKRVKNPDKITMHCNLDHLDDPIEGLNDTPTEPGVLTSTVFRHMLPFHKCEPMTPRGITLEGVNLRYCATSYCAVMDFSKVQKLNIRACTSADALLAALCASSRLPEKLIKLEVKHDEESEECETMAALDTFLCLVSGIKILTIDIGNSKRLPVAAGITRHAKTLERLICHAWKPKLEPRDRGPSTAERVFDAEAFEKITKACTRIEQLSLAFPLIHIDRRSTVDFDAFTTCLRDLPNLRTINSTTFPQYKHRERDGHLPRKLYESLLRTSAQEGFETSIEYAARRVDGKQDTPEATDPTTPPAPRSPYSKLKVISWGISDKIFDRIDSQEIYVFVKGLALDPMGGPAKCLAQKISMRLIHYWERKSDILSVPLLNREVSPPTKENEDLAGDWD